MTDAPLDVEALRAALTAAQAEAAQAKAMLSGNEAVIATLKLEIEKLRRALYGQKCECRA
jgi:capsule polysaccharide export protein KpsE/RkpR